MQVLKEEVRQAILYKAMDEFYDNGFQKASLRKIVKSAGTTIGNFYNYFKNKEELFYAITTPIYTKFVYFIKNHNEDQDDISDLSVEELRKLIAHSLKSIDKEFERALIILIDGSKGTKYEDVKEEIIGFLAQHFVEHLNEGPTHIKKDIHPYFSKVVAVGFLEGVMDTLRSGYTKEEKEKLIADYIILFALGAEKFASN